MYFFPEVNMLQVRRQDSLQPTITNALQKFLLVHFNHRDIYTGTFYWGNRAHLFTSQDSSLSGLNQWRRYDCGRGRVLGPWNSSDSTVIKFDYSFFYYHHYPNKEDTKTHLTKDLLINLQISWHWFICGLYLDSRWFCFWLYFCWRGKTKVGRLYVF